MAYRNFNETKALDRGTVRLTAQIPTNGSSALSTTNQKGQGWAATRTGVGTMSLVLGTGLKFNNLLYAQANLMLNAQSTNDATNLQVRLLGWTASTKTLLLGCFDGTGAAAEWPAANANNVVFVNLVMSNTSAVPLKG